MENDNKTSQEEELLLSQVKGYLSLYLMKILENEGASGIISSILRDNTKEVSQLRRQVEELKNEVNELKNEVNELRAYNDLTPYSNGLGGINISGSGGDDTVSPPWYGNGGTVTFGGELIPVKYNNSLINSSRY